MKRLHIHLSVENLEQNINFYSTLFGSEPTIQHNDYAKWMLDDPRVNFAISNRSAKTGLDHLGIQADNDEELQQIKQAIKDNCCVELNGELMAQDWAAGFIELNRHKRGGV
jgi:catechol 2,3-dioxygenase-like lactoylglutathione lyase family enzyme